MKPILLGMPVLLLMSCTPRILYLGERYPPYQAQPIEIYFDEGQISRPYQVIGSLVNAGGGVYVTQERVQQKMVDEAQAVGADAIVFHDIDVELNNEGGGAVILKAKAIRY